jgi:hypothetical protein
MNRKIDPETPNATRKPFQKSVKSRSSFYFLSTVAKKILLSIGNKKLKLNDSFEIILMQTCETRLLVSMFFAI